MAKKSRGTVRPSVWKSKDGSWCGEVYLGKDADGKRQRKRWRRRTRAELLEVIEQWKSEPADGGQDKLGPSMREWMDQIKKPMLKGSSYQTVYTIVTQHILPALGEKSVTAVKAADIQSLIGGMDRSISTKRKAASILCDYYRWYIRTHDLDIRNPAERISVGREKLRTEADWYLSDKDCAEFIRVCREQGHPRADLCELMLQTGLRVGEALALTDDDLDWNTDTLSVTKTVSTARDIDARTGERGPIDHGVINTPKSRSGRRYLPLNPRAAEIIKNRCRQLDYDHPTDGRLWQGTPPDMDQYVKRLYKAIGWTGRQGCHLLRHSYVVAMLRAAQTDSSITLAEISALVGHSSISITVDTYGHVSELVKRTRKEGSHPRFDPSVKKQDVRSTDTL